MDCHNHNVGVGSYYGVTNWTWTCGSCSYSTHEHMSQCPKCSSHYLWGIRIPEGVEYAVVEQEVATPTKKRFLSTFVSRVLRRGERGEKN